MPKKEKTMLTKKHSGSRSTNSRPTPAVLFTDISLLPQLHFQRNEKIQDRWDEERQAQTSLRCEAQNLCSL